uniref:Uncharacterized protein n=1 Tax=Caenorhabditis tropicalis TaxID=1561998 RepID=A0A1I7T1D9_9PELO
MKQSINTLVVFSEMNEQRHQSSAGNDDDSSKCAESKHAEINIRSRAVIPSTNYHLYKAPGEGKKKKKKEEEEDGFEECATAISLRLRGVNVLSFNSATDSFVFVFRRGWHGFKFFGARRTFVSVRNNFCGVKEKQRAFKNKWAGL